MSFIKHQTNELRSLLVDWGLKEMANNFIDCGFDRIDDLKIITEHDLNALFPGDAMRGKKCRLRAKIADWRERNGFRITVPTLSIVYTQEVSYNNQTTVNNEPSPNSVPVTSIELVETIGPRKLKRRISSERDPLVIAPGPAPTPSVSSLPQIAQAQTKINFSTFLKTPQGGKIMEHYRSQEPKHLTDIAKNLLIDYLIDYFIINNQKMQTADFEDISHAIEETFNFENADYYYHIGNNRQTGRLYNKYRNVTWRLKKRDPTMSLAITPAKVKKSKITVNDDETSSDQDIFVRDFDYENDKIWLGKNINLPLEELESKWRDTFKGRRQEIQEGIYDDTEELLKKWPHFAEYYGHFLIDIDFNLMFPKSQIDFFMKWHNSVKTLHGIMQKKIKDKRYLNQIQLLPVDINKQVYTILTSINAMLKPTGKLGNKFTSKIWRVSIDEAAQSFFFEVDSENEYESKIAEREEIYEEHGLVLSPFIVIMKKSSQKYSVRYKNIIHNFDQLLDAVEALIKMKTVLDLSYPFESLKAWIFLQHFYFGIKNSGTKNDAEIISLLAELEIESMR